MFSSMLCCSDLRPVKNAERVVALNFLLSVEGKPSSTMVTTEIALNASSE